MRVGNCIHMHQAVTEVMLTLFLTRLQTYLPNLAKFVLVRWLVCLAYTSMNVCICICSQIKFIFFTHSMCIFSHPHSHRHPHRHHHFLVSSVKTTSISLLLYNCTFSFTLFSFICY